jgi:phage major head subunit gpT-like protein
MAQNTAKYEAILRDLTHKFDMGVANATPFYPSVCDVVQSTGADEKYGFLGQVPSVREWLGDRQFNEMRASDFTITNRLWEDSILVPKTNMDDDRMGLFDKMFANLGQRGMLHPDKLLMEAIVAGESTACHDGQYFFDTDHSWGSSGSQDNDLTGAAATGTAPTEAEFKAAFETSVAAMLAFVDDRGEPLNQPTVGQLNDLMVLVPVAYYATAYKAVNAAILSNNSNVQVWSPRVVASPFLTSGAKFYTFYTGGMLKPFVFQAREPLSRQSKGIGDIETKEVKFMTQARYNVGYLAWWNAVLYTFT